MGFQTSTGLPNYNQKIKHSFFIMRSVFSLAIFLCVLNAATAFSTFNSVSIVPDDVATVSDGLKGTPADCIKKHCKKQGTACLFDSVRTDDDIQTLPVSPPPPPPFSHLHTRCHHVVAAAAARPRTAAANCLLPRKLPSSLLIHYFRLRISVTTNSFY